jgi:tRNA A-37 threonylcarbamoyl transferase component Bud32
MFEFLTLKNFPELQSAVLRPATSTRPAVFRVMDGEVKAVVKDFSRLGFLYRNTVGRFLVWRESKAYRHLQGVDGTPRLFRVIDGLALVIEEIRGRSLENAYRDITLPPSFFNELEDLVSRVHERGIAHCDLKKAANTLLGKDGRPYIIDWGAAILEREFRWYPLNLVFKKFVTDDHMAVVKLKICHIPESVSSKEWERYNTRSRGECLVRSIRDRLRNLLQKVV